MEELCDSDLISYVSTKGLTREKILQEIRDDFKTYEDFKYFLEEFENEV